MGPVTELLIGDNPPHPDPAETSINGKNEAARSITV